MANIPKASLDKWPSLAKIVDSGVESHDGREARLLTWIYSHPSLPQMRNSPSTILAAMDEFAGQQEFLISVGEDKARILSGLVAKEKPKTFVEVGGYVGYSAILFADAMRRARPGEELKLWSLELDPLFASIAMNLIDLAGLGDVVKVVTGSATDSLVRLTEQKMLSQIDMLLLDHLEELYIAEFHTCERLGLLKAGAVIIADNVQTPGAPEYREMVRSHPGLESEGVKALIMPGGFEDEIEVSRFKTKT